MNSKSTDEILEVILRESAAILSVDRGAFSADTPLSALGFDSMRFVELLVAIEIHLKTCSLNSWIIVTILYLLPIPILKNLHSYIDLIMHITMLLAFLLIGMKYDMASSIC
jgi:hypothetical protein